MGVLGVPGALGFEDCLDPPCDDPGALDLLGPDGIVGGREEGDDAPLAPGLDGANEPGTDEADAPDGEVP